MTKRYCSDFARVAQTRNIRIDSRAPMQEPRHDFEIFRRAVMVIGPHGQQLWNMAFCRLVNTVRTLACAHPLWMNTDASQQEQRTMDDGEA